MVSNPFVPRYLISREAELQQISDILVQDGDFLLLGAPGTGRRTLIRAAATQVSARVLEIDCLRATNAKRFLQLLADTLTEVFANPNELALIQRWTTHQPIVLDQTLPKRARLVWHSAPSKEWALFQTLLELPQLMAEWLNCRIVIVFLNFPHIRSWDRSGNWETYFRTQIDTQSQVSYALVATVAEPWLQNSNLPVISLAPLEDDDLKPWIVATMASEGLQFDAATGALALFLSYVQGNLGDAIVLARRVWMDYCAFTTIRHERDKSDEEAIQAMEPGVVYAHHVHRSAIALIDDLSITFESLILLLPPSQVRVLESLALDPTDSPHARDYIRKHQLSKGGGLQGALSGLEQKGLVYGPKYGYRIALPLLDLWLKQRVG
ncbi:ATP-binding protein [Oculatella sp. LEGE 06141]|uniref:ATP-binding protein n=1 Tax=Oculatella sp. LEGE 06141 TaxID=1828648 RepID=UPI001881AB9A|nr:ATP-binding protein [Oculatella sp. LEGE 06141]MBE9180919.1 ATP-binding protein [Oculatella sp. LEGE 06141]